MGYIERYIPELIPKLFPVQSPLMCAAKYARKELGITDRFAFISPCIAKKMEIDDPNNHGLGSIYPMPGGLKENVLWLLGEDAFIRQVEGEKRLYHYFQENKELLRDGKTPYLFVDALNCEMGCICGTGTEQSLSSTDFALCNLNDIKESVKKKSSGSAWSKYATPDERLRAT